MTIDSKILTRREDLSLESGNYGIDILEKGQYLMEVKILGAIPLGLTSIFSDLKIYSTHFSKYGNEFMAYCNKNNKQRRQEIC